MTTIRGGKYPTFNGHKCTEFNAWASSAKPTRCPDFGAALCHVQNGDKKTGRVKGYGRACIKAEQWEKDMGSASWLQRDGRP